MLDLLGASVAVKELIPLSCCGGVVCRLPHKATSHIIAYYVKQNVDDFCGVADYFHVLSMMSVLLSSFYT